MEHVLFPEYTGIFGIEAEHEANAEFIEGFLRLGIVWINILGKNPVVEGSHYLSGFYTDFQFLPDMDMVIVYKKRQSVEFLLQICQMNDFRSIARTLHVVDFKSLEVACHYPLRLLRDRQSGGIAPCLLVGSEFRSVRLPILGRKIHMNTFLLYQHLCGGDIAVDEIGTFLFGYCLDRYLEFNRFDRVFNSKHIMQKGHPKALGLSLFIAFSCPFFNELPDSRLLIVYKIHRINMIRDISVSVGFPTVHGAGLR